MCVCVQEAVKEQRDAAVARADAADRAAAEYVVRRDYSDERDGETP
jgi:hypothetical protein